MARRRFDHIRGSWLALVVLLCLGAILGLGLGSERVRRVVRESLPAALGGTAAKDRVIVEEAPDPAVAAAAKEKPPDPDALPAVPKEDSFQGIVRDAAGKPIAGAAVSAERWRESRWEVLATTRTNSRGEFVVGPLPRAHLSAVARAEGYASARKPAKTGARIEFTLKKGGNFHGKVVDAANGEPVADCYLSAYSMRGDWWETTRTAKDGTFRFASVTPGLLWVSVVPPAHLPTNLSDVEVLEGKDAFKEIPVVKGGKLKGRVLDRETKSPVPGAKIRTWDGVKNAVAGEDGRFEMPSPGSGGFSFKVSAERYPEQWSWLNLSGDPQQDVERDIEIGKGAKVSGVVLKPDGNPAEGARVGRDAGELMTGVPENSSLTDAEGRFTLDAVPAWRGLRLFAVCEGFALSRSDPLDVRSGSEVGGIRILLQTGATFKGTVKDEEGNPLPGVSLAFERQWTPQDGQQGWFWIPDLVAYSLADGTWELAGVPAATWKVRADLEGYAPETRPDTVAPAEGVLEGQDFVLRKGSSITGVVRNREGELLAGVSVTAWGWVMGSQGEMDWVARSEVRTDAEGRFTLDGLRDGAYQVSVAQPGYAGQDLQGIMAGTRDLQILLLPTARIEGAVVEADGVTPVPSFNLRVYLEVDADGNPQHPGNQIQGQDFADREGKFVLKDLAAGQYALLAVAGNKVSRRLGGILVGTGGSVVDLRLPVSPGGRLKVTVRDGTGQPLKDAYVSAGRKLPDGNFQNDYWAQTDAEGVGLFAAMSDGQWILWANHHGKVQETKTVVVGGGVDAEVDMVLTMGGGLLVAVRDGKGSPVEGANVSFTDAAGQEIPIDWGRVWQAAWRKYGGRVDWEQAQREATHTDRDGKLLREAIKAGDVRVTVRKEGYLEAVRTFRVQDGFEVDGPVLLEKVPEAPPPGGGGDPAPPEPAK